MNSVGNEKSLRIGMMIETDGPGGAEVVLIQLSEELRRRGHQVIEVGPAQGKGWLSGRLAELNFERRTFTLRRAIDPLCAWRMTQMLSEMKVDVVHSHEFTMAVYGALACRFLSIPHVVTLHGGDGAFAAFRRRAALRWSQRNSQAFVGVSRHTSDFMAEKLGIDIQAIKTVHNGIFQRDGKRVETRAALGLGSDDVLVLAVGNARPRKGQIHLLQAMAALDAEGVGQSLHIAVAGDGPERVRMQDFAEQHGLSHRVHLLGLRRDIEDLQSAADIAAMPSYWEGLPLAVLEGMFGSNAILASDVGGIGEAVRDGIDGLLVPPGDVDHLAQALRYLLDNPEERRAMGQAAQKRALEKFSVAAMADQYEALYRGQDRAS